jgi:hypothetical protein
MGGVPAETAKVEDIVARVASGAKPNTPLNLWIPHEMTLRDEPVAHEAAMAIVADAGLGAGLTVDGFTDGDGGRTYHYGPW